jgi:hypothetical protein
MIIVTGIVRSGLSMTMQMLHAGGYPCVGEPAAFEEHGIGTIPWVEYSGKMVAVKAVDGVHDLPPRPLGPFDVIRLHRDLDQQACSTNKFNRLLGGLPVVSIRKYVKSFKREYHELDAFYKRDRVLHLHFEKVLEDPLGQAERVVEWLEYRDHPELNVEAMAAAVVRRGPGCLGWLLEAGLIDRYAGRCTMEQLAEWVAKMREVDYAG